MATMKRRTPSTAQMKISTTPICKVECQYGTIAGDKQIVLHW